MKFRQLLGILFISACAISGNAKTPSKAHEAHRAAHREQLANNKSRLDKSVIKDFIEHDVAIREEADNLTGESAMLVNDLLKEANKHIGKRYRHGAKGPSAFDCSGFSSYVYRQFGYTLSPSSRTQYTQGKAVDRHNLRKGDLVFFTSRSSGSGVGHVGIVVEADNDKGTFRFIHASIRGVKISDYAGYYLNRYIGARRVID